MNEFKPRHIAMVLGLVCWLAAIITSFYGFFSEFTRQDIQWIVAVGFVLVSIADISIIVIVLIPIPDNFKENVLDIIAAGAVVSIFSLLYVMGNEIHDRVTIGLIVCISQCGTALLFWLDGYLHTKEELE